ncbi:Predicted RNA binding protein YcfA, dsRBD-like fold, HicA-like mRNA interferase family [Hathewaya proteolytica DSM 3090]|uniref:Predicted RNA binding protein YcfA, dsRBD-like fold, HicA-like mRNA interferase family n=1 Tax=Hathewaya proteolytica DSM 3090 TaxID=1121331 RepID=A0A1M6L2L6_9CLOT|nr:type II toxin-antitoxin system HicA family toxin [Hathewaya proteolytica]SHJ65505.1 Predicted RNA binding protein YcfA, dsRBD-like fold, HicA-like mRNA interferase family [Hathewaya proteolytica DSM 3090]
MNFVRKSLETEFREAQKQLESLFISNIDKAYAGVKKEFDKKYDELCETLNYIIKNTSIHNIKPITDGILEKGMDEFYEYVKKKIADIINNVFNRNVIEQLATIDACIDIAKTINHQKVSNNFKFIKGNIVNRMNFINNIMMQEIYNIYFVEMMNDLKQNYANYLEVLQLQMDKRIKEIDKNKFVDKTLQIQNQYTKNNTEKIFDYKKMNKLLAENGYAAIRQKGDHKIYNNGSKSIPVPQHTLGKGLSCKIQKQM